MKECFIHDWRQKPGQYFSNANGTYCMIKCAVCGLEETRLVNKSSHAIPKDVSKWPRWKEKR